MGRDDHNRKLHNGAKPQLPQTPQNMKAGQHEETELANELGDLYKLEVKPGFGPTGVTRKEP